MLPFYREPSCPFCAVIAREAPAQIVREWEMVIAFVPLNPVTTGHTLIVPKVHFTRPEEARIQFMRVNDMATEYATSQGGDYNLICNAGPEATQTVNHLHLHYIPRHANDGLMLPWSNQYRPEGHHE